MRMSLTLLLLFLVLSLSAQITHKNNVIRIGDEIIKQQIEYKDPGRSGQNVVWDFSKLQTINESYILSYTKPWMLNDSTYLLAGDSIVLNLQEKETVIVGIEHDTRYYYHIINDSLFLKGYENPKTKMINIRPEITKIFPEIYGKSYFKYYEGKGKYCDFLSLDVIGVQSQIVDASGMIILPNKDTLNNILRIKTNKKYIEKLSPLLTSDEIKDAHLLEIDSIRYYLSTDSETIEIETYQWYATGYRYPIFETTKSTTNNEHTKEFFKLAFFYSPLKHYYLADDSENLSVLDSLHNSLKPKSDLNEKNIGEFKYNNNFAYNFYPNPIASLLNIEYYLTYDVDVSISLYDVSGKKITGIYQYNKQAGLYQESINCFGLSSGTYFLHFNIGNEQIVEKILKN
ncbi:T9SS C-terminal target domain-containing protein [Dysgonomonas sp. 216]|uniref:T9SS type A sorting domain-containing protein n=1 Tax=Dysgonomonas sp. 216 TaxID=2302934 RepID=UPI0013D8E01C|nr:T9SS type A sorting domain-containing protein [Dysgonomonas sp. 216]NDW17921.1 T9SS C-terminal target domain-containing protein [Dysgonomonas sp. 216]